MNSMFKPCGRSLVMLSMFGLLSLSVMGLNGCSSSETETTATDVAPEVKKIDDSHGGWWCVEHGVPEGECALCDKSLVAEFKEKGDWCEEHDRPESQCFICSPKRADKFIARYEAKTGRKPPEPTE